MLVGKNESGKTALLTALYRTNPIISDDAEFDETYDYPKREVETYRIAVENEERGKAVVVDCLWELEDADLAVVTEIFGEGVLKDKQFRRKTRYGRNDSKFELAVDESAAREHLASNSNFPNDLQETLKSKGDWTEFAEALDAAEETEAVDTCKGLVAKVKDGLAHYIFSSLIWPRAPSFCISTNTIK